MKKKNSFWENIKAFHLRINIAVLIVLIVVFVMSILAYMYPELRKNKELSNLLLALFTTFLASILAMIVQIYVEYINMQRDEFLKDIHKFGIERLDIQKDVLLKEMLQDCRNEIWISGYRLILSNTIKTDIADAVKRGATVKIMVCPPWSEAFQLIYGKNEKIIDNYYSVFHAIYEVIKECKYQKNDYKVYFLEKPIFSDVYKVDQNLVTGPYLHNRDEEYNRIMAKDFFSYVLVPGSDLYCLVKKEYETLIEEVQQELDWAKFDDAYLKMYRHDYNEQKKIKCLKKACVKIKGKNKREN